MGMNKGVLLLLLIVGSTLAKADSLPLYQSKFVKSSAVDKKLAFTQVCVDLGYLSPLRKASLNDTQASIKAEYKKHMKHSKSVHEVCTKL
jgi:hypothetical protein